MKKISIKIMLFSLLFVTSLAQAESHNPFTMKGAGEFTKADREKLEREIQGQVDMRISVLEEKIRVEIDQIRRENAEKNSVRRNQLNRAPIEGNNSPNVDGFETPKPKLDKFKDAMFIGCIDKKALYKNKKTNEQFFIPVEEAKENEEFNKMGGCGF